MKQLLFLIRHASREKDWTKEEQDHPMIGWVDPLDLAQPADFQKQGLPQTLALFGRLCDELPLEGVSVDHEIQIFHSEHRVAKQTAGVLVTVLQQKRFRRVSRNSHSELTPSSSGLTSSFKDLRQKIAAAEKSNAVMLLISHQPLLTHLATKFCPDLPGNVLPLGNSEIACIEKGDVSADFQLKWLLTNKSEALRDTLIDKVKSKYETAKFFLGALVIGNGLLLQTETWRTLDFLDLALVALGTISLLIAFGLSVLTLLHYDRLTMPPDFWGEAQTQNTDRVKSRKWNVKRPPGQSHMVIYYDMVHVWDTYFVPALFWAIGALVLFALAFAYRAGLDFLTKEGETVTNVSQNIFLVLVLVAFLVIVVVAIRSYDAKNRPVLNVDD